MTREYALKVLDTIPTIGDQVDALEMAISALEHEDAVIDQVLEIIDRTRNRCRKEFTRCNEPIILSAIEGYAAALRQEILVLKGGEHEISD